MNLKERLSLYKVTYSDTRSLIRPKGKFSKLIGFLKFLRGNQFALPAEHLDPQLSAAYQFRDLCKWIKLDTGCFYLYPFDYNVIRCIRLGYHPIASVTVDGRSILKTSIKSKKKEVLDANLDETFSKSLVVTLDSIEQLCKRASKELEDSSTTRSKLQANYINNIISKPAESFDEGIQRILFFNALFWQNRHMQNGIGRLDLVLGELYKHDLENHIITRDSAKLMLKEMVAILGKDTAYKSAALIGDTGQVIILGGYDEQGNTIHNDITEILLEIFAERPVPDPKLILRVTKETDDIIWNKAIASILKGSGSPLIANDDVIMPLMVQFGYDNHDVYNYGTSACWEPLIIGKSLDQNNCIRNITILDVIPRTLQHDSLKTFEEFKKALEREVLEYIHNLNLCVKFERSPLFSLFFDNCIENGLDFSKGGAKYNYHGLLVVGLPNLINSILNIKKYVFEEHLCTLSECKYCIENDFESREDLLALFRNNTFKFGLADKEIVSLTNFVTGAIEKGVSKRRLLNERLKVGFSSPGYINLSRNYPASIDGRRKGDPFAVHISPISSKIDIAEILDFASKMNYDGCRLNGNVVDFIVPHAFANNPAKFMSIVKNAFARGVFEMQLNTLNKKTLIDAKEHPENYPNLIVRVWGFSAYFNDLPEEYKDNLIARSEMYEA